jgi:hypothetical protein
MDRDARQLSFLQDKDSDENRAERLKRIMAAPKESAP